MSECLQSSKRSSDLAKVQDEHKRVLRELDRRRLGCIGRPAVGLKPYIYNLYVIILHIYIYIYNYAYILRQSGQLRNDYIRYHHHRHYLLLLLFSSTPTILVRLEYFREYFEAHRMIHCMTLIRQLVSEN